MTLIETTYNNKRIVVKQSKSEYCSLIKDYTIDCYELYIDGNHMDNFNNLDDLNEYLNDL